jgi:MFS family permease
MGGLVGHRLAADKSLATLPITLMVVGTAMTTIPAALFMGRFGRRNGFVFGALIGSMGGAVAAYAIVAQSFALFCLGHLLVGVYQGFANYYRFAAAETAGESFKGPAISLVLAGGVVAAVAGPEIGKWTKDMLAPAAFAGSYVALGGLSVFAAFVLLLIDMPKPVARAFRTRGRSLPTIMRQPVFLVAAAGAAIGYAVMILVMTATPLAMVAHRHAVGDAVFVIQWHVLGMFVPSFFTGGLIRRFGAVTILLCGIVLLLVHVTVAVTGTDLLHFTSALVLLGVGWNFAFIGGTTLLTETHTAEEQAKTQAANDFIVFGTVALASLSSGWLLQRFGWQTLNYVAVPILLLAGSLAAWLLLRRHATPLEVPAKVDLGA